jgi:putative ABC transport system substrate-binding protein
VRRREFIGLVGGAATAGWPLAARAQQPQTTRKIGYLDVGPASARVDRVEALRAGLRDLGYVEGKNIAIEFRWAERTEQLPDLAADLVRRNVDVIFAVSSTMVEPARRATSTIPIVFATHADPVGLGHVVSLARPGGNITGLSMVFTDLVAKELEILTEVVPQAKRIAVLFNPTTPSLPPAMKAVDVAGQRLGLQLTKVPAQAGEDFDGAFALRRAEALMVVASPLFITHREPLAELAKKHRLPAMFGSKENVQAGGLISYGADLTDLHRRAGTYIDKILKASWEQALTWLLATCSQIVVERLPCDLGQLKSDRPTRFPLADRRPVDRVTVRRDVVHAESDEVASAQLAVDREIEQCQVARVPFKLQPGSDRPHVPRPQWRLWSGELALVPHRSTRPCDW